MTLNRVAFGIMSFLGLAVALATFRFIPLGWNVSFPDFGDHIANRRLAFSLHVILASVALMLAVPQLLPGLRRRVPALHRWTGRAYALCVAVSGGAGGALAIFAPGGWVAGAGFALLAGVWLYVTARAVSHARARRIAEHRAWMIRSVALTFAGVTLRIYLGGFMLAGIGYVEISPLLAWICWVPNLVLVELYLRRAAATIV